MVESCVYTRLNGFLCANQEEMHTPPILEFSTITNGCIRPQVHSLKLLFNYSYFEFMKARQSCIQTTTIHPTLSGV